MKKRWFLIAVPVAIYLLMWEHTGPWIMPRRVTLRVVANDGRPLPGAAIKVTQTTWTFPCLISGMGQSAASCGSYDSTTFDGKLDRNGETTAWVMTATGFSADPYIACIEGDEYEGYGAYAEWPKDPSVKIVTLDFGELHPLRKGCSSFSQKLATPPWWSNYMHSSASATGSAQDMPPTAVER